MQQLGISLTLAYPKNSDQNKVGEKMIYLPNAVIAPIMLAVGLFINTRDLLLNRWTKTSSTLS